MILLLKFLVWIILIYYTAVAFADNDKSDSDKGYVLILYYGGKSKLYPKVFEDPTECHIKFLELGKDWSEAYPDVDFMGSCINVDELKEETKESHSELDALPLEYKLNKWRAGRQVDPLCFVNNFDMH